MGIINEKIITFNQYLQQQKERYNKNLDEHFFDDAVSIGKLQAIIEVIQKYGKIFEAELNK